MHHRLLKKSQNSLQFLQTRPNINYLSYPRTKATRRDPLLGPYELFYI